MGKHAFGVHFLTARIAHYMKDIFTGARSLESQDAAVKQHRRIAVVISHEKNMWALAVVQRFFSSLREQMGYQHTPEFEVFAAQGSKSRLSSLMARLRQRHEGELPYEAVLTVGNWCSKEVKEALESWSKPPPQVFCPTSDPVAMGLVDSLEHTGGHISGVTSVLPCFSKQLEVLKALRPGIQKILTIYDSFSSDSVMAANIAKYHQNLTNACDKHGFVLESYTFTSPGRSVDELAELMSGCDVVCTLPEPTVYARMDLLAEACNRTKTLLCSTELSSLYHGAAIGFGEHGDVYGAYAASIVYDMLVNHRPVSTIPVIKLSHEPHTRFNQEALEMQGLCLSPQIKCLLSMTSVFKD